MEERKRVDAAEQGGGEQDLGRHVRADGAAAAGHEARVVVGACTTLGRHVLVSRGALIRHGIEIGDYVSVQRGANIAGACRIGAQSYVGMGAIVIDHLSVGAGSVNGAGA